MYLFYYSVPTLSYYFILYSVLLTMFSLSAFCLYYLYQLWFCAISVQSINTQYNTIHLHFNIKQFCSEYDNYLVTYMQREREREREREKRERERERGGGERETTCDVTINFRYAVNNVL